MKSDDCDSIGRVSEAELHSMSGVDDRDSIGRVSEAKLHSMSGVTLHSSPCV